MRSRWGSLAGAVLAAGAVTSGADTASAAAGDGTATVVGSTLVFVAGANAANEVEFFFAGNGDGNWHAKDVVPVVAGAGCGQVSAHEVSCAGVTAISGDGGNLNDTLGVRESLALAAGSPATAGMRLVGGTGDDRLNGGFGNDSLDGGPGADVLRGGFGADTATYAARMWPVTADADGATGDDGEAGERDSIGADVENLVGGTGPDMLAGNGSTNLLIGGPGADRIFGLDGNDRLYGAAGHDLLDGGAGPHDVCSVGPDGANPVGCETVTP